MKNYLYEYSSNLKRKKFLFRPLLFISRFDLKKICDFWKLPIYPDKTNQKLIFYRNRIRKQLIPFLKIFFNSQIEQALFNFSEIISAEHWFLNSLTLKICSEIEYKKQYLILSQQNSRNNIRNNKKFFLILLDASFFKTIPIALKRKVLTLFFKKYIKTSFNFYHIENFLWFIECSKNFQELPKVYPNYVMPTNLSYFKKKNNNLKINNLRIKKTNVSRFRKKTILKSKILYSPGIGTISIFSHQISIFCHEQNEYF